MKILAIRGKNLASLDGEFQIDFATEPLKSAGLFAITGSTGAGKSTILDALCLALFDDTPRFKNAGNGEIIDSSGKTVTQKNSANILRKGTGEGYAEVDFVALNGMIYRSKWSIKRARTKPDGALQNSDISLLNVTNNTHCQGTKTELLIEITRIIGLSFSQFTRAVLLAQGDFATFMKANDSDKAEILEKLTGTDIYTRISTNIYERYKIADAEFLNIRSKINDVSLLTVDEFDALELKLNSLAAEISQIKVREQQLNKRLEWLNINEQLQIEITNTRSALAAAKLALEESKPRQDYIAMVNSVQEIRDTYNLGENSAKQLIDSNKQLGFKQAETIKISDELSKVATQHRESETRLTALRSEYEVIAPDIVKARTIDVKIDEMGKNAKSAQKEVDDATDRGVSLDKLIVLLERDIVNKNNEIALCQEWLNLRREHLLIVSKYDLVISVLNNYQAAKKQFSSNVTLYESNSEQLEVDKRLLKEQEEALMSLDTILPDEIVSLRKKLVEGDPCPICGSVHHPLSNEVNQKTKMREEEINRSKDEVKKLIEKISNVITNSESELTRLKTMIEGYGIQVSISETELNEYLVSIPNWRKLNDEEKLKDGLTKLTTKWNEKTNEKQDAEKLLSELEVKLELTQSNRANIKSECVEKASKLANYQNALIQLQQERRAIFDGRKADEVEQEYKNAIEKESLEKDRLLTNKTILGNKQQGIAGEITQIENYIKALNETIIKCDLEVNRWLLNTGGAISVSLLKELLSITVAWIEQERNALNSINEKRITIEAKLNEQSSKLKKHHESEYRELNKLVSPQILQNEIEELSEKLVSLNSLHSDAELELKDEIRNREMVSKYDVELSIKSAEYQNWAKLNELFGSASGDKFKKIAQGYTLDSLLAFANKHLEELTKRYKLQRIVGKNNDGLGLQVIDDYSYGDIRSVHSLSGGESFLISLALALGLSSLSSNKMNIESLFIDEGFGSLDIDTLRVAMSALEHLQTQGRKIGVISHVQEMTEQIKVKIEVRKTANGKSKVEVTESN